jgi:hypothetical protein
MHTLVCDEKAKFDHGDMKKKARGDQWRKEQN